jgi:import receptor subunit TOM20
LKKGDEVTISFVDVTRHPGESVAECRRRRRHELARGWRFACSCERCKQVAEGLSLEEKGGAEAEKERDDSKIEDTAEKFAGLRNADRDVE